MRRLSSSLALAICLIGLFLAWPQPGYGWVQRSQITSGSVDAAFPSGVRDSQGRIHVVWLQKENGAEEAFYTVGDGVTWQKPRNLSRSAARTLSVRIAVNERDDVVVFWVDVISFLGLDIGSQLFSAARNGNSWGPTHTLSDPWTTPSVGPPALAVDGIFIHAVWAADTGIDGYGDAIYHGVWAGDWSIPDALPLQTGTLDTAALTLDADGRMHLVWDGNTTGNPADHNAYQIYYARETESGWTTPVNISQSSTYSFLSALALDGAGHPHVIWLEEDTGTGQGIHIFDRILYQRWDGSAWLPQPQQLSYRSGVLFPQAGSDENGNVHFLWNNNISSNSGVYAFRLYYTRWDGASLSPAMRILGTPGPDSAQSAGDFVRSAGSQLAADRLSLLWGGGDEGGIGQIFYAEQPAGQVSQAEVESSQSLADAPDLAGRAADDLHAVWAQGTGPSDILYSHWNGVRWSNPYSLSLPGFNSAWPAIALGPDGAPHAAWYGHDAETSDRIYYTRLTGTGWQTPTLLSHEWHAAGAPDLAVDSAGDVHLVWEMRPDPELPSFAVYYRRTVGGGQSDILSLSKEWQPWEQISPAGHSANRPQLALDGNGAPHVVWYDVGEEEVYYSNRMGGSWATPQNLSQSPATLVGTTISSQGPALAVESSGRVYVAWMESVSRQYLDSIGLAVWEGGSWQRRLLMSRPEIARDMDRNSGINAQVALGSQGDVHVVWHDVGESSQLHIYESNNLAGASWSLPTHISTDTGGAMRPGAFVDSGGALHLVWTDFYQSRQVFYQRQNRFDWLKVADSDGRPQPGALLYANGRPIGQSDSRGLFLPDGLLPGDELTALAPVDEYTGVRGNHTSPDAPDRNWAYRTYLTNWRYDGQGNRLGEPFSAGRGEQRLTVYSDSPLALFNLLVSLQWDADIAYTETFSRALRLASDYLFDASNGQMALGNIAIYSGGESWQEADLQVLAYNHSRPNADINGLRDALSPSIRVGRSWSGKVGGAEEEGAWDQPDGYRTLIHEFGHYALGLWDSYFRILRDEQGNQKDQVTAHCTGPEIRSNDQNPVNATLMDYQYNASEFAMRGSAAWDESYCSRTEQFARHGQSDWETIRRFFGDSQDAARWQWQTPAETGILSGPAVQPLLGLPVIAATAPVTPAVTTPLLLRGPDNSVQKALVTTYGQSTQGRATIDQGQSDGQGLIRLLGVRDGDVAKALSWDGVYSGETALTAGVTNTLVLTRPVGAASREAYTARYLRLLPHVTGRAVDAQLSGLGAGAALEVILDLTGRDLATQEPMGYSGLTGVYQARITPAFADGSATLDGLAQVQVVGKDVEGQPVYLPARVAFYSLQPGLGRYLASPDGRLRLSLPADAAPETGSPVRLLLSEQNSFGNPDGMVFLSPVYELRLGGSLPGFAAPATLSIHADEARSRADVSPVIVRFDEAGHQWQPLTTGWDGESRVASTAISGAGFYGLVAEEEVGEMRLYLPGIRN